MVPFHDGESGVRPENQPHPHKGPCQPGTAVCPAHRPEAGAAPERLERAGAASSFHDTRRHDDYLDVGHGARGAAYYHAYCKGKGLPFYRLAARIMQYHDHPDTLGNKIIGERFGKHGVLLYHIFKDADALDRFRLGPGGFDPRYLRTPEGKALYDYAKNIWAQVIKADPSLDRHWLEEKKKGV